MEGTPKYVFPDYYPIEEGLEEVQEFNFEPTVDRNIVTSTSNCPSTSATVFPFPLPKSTSGAAASSSSSPVFKFPPKRNPPPKIPSLRLRSRTNSSFAETPRNFPPRNYSSSSTGNRTRRSGNGKSTDATSATIQCSVLVALVEGRGNAKGEVGLASIDLKNPVLILSQFGDNATYTKLATKLVILDPIEIILPNTTYDNNRKTGSDLAKCLKEQLPDVRLNSVQRRYFNEGIGVQYIRELCAPEYISVEMDLYTKYYSLAAAAALLKYVEFVQHSQYIQKSLKVVYQGSLNTMMIDAITARNLEVINNNTNLRNKGSLFGVMNFTKTPGGSRLLRANLMQPPCDAVVIADRLDCVKEILEDQQHMFATLQSLLGRFINTEHLLSSCVQVPKTENIQVAQQKINNVLYLKHTLEMAEALKTYTKKFKHPRLVAYHKALENPQFGEILELIRDTIHEDARYVKGAPNMIQQRCYAVKPNRSGLLDVSRKIFSETVEDIIGMVRQLGEFYGMPMLRSSYNTSRGYFVQLPVIGKVDPESINLPSTFLKVVRTKNSINFTTDELIKLNCRAKESLEEIYVMSSRALTTLLSDICKKVHCLHSLAECVANLDMLMSLAQAATIGDYVRPEFTDTIAIRNGRHPILDRIDSEPLVPNDTFLSEDSNMRIITGPNMSGKSTYLRQVALLQVMAQVGSYVPAEYASFKICDHIFSRIGNNDDMEANASTFMIEMQETSYILKNVTNNSLIIIDELGRGTSVEEGAGICYAFCEFLQSLKACTLVATHFKDVCLLDLNFPNVSNSHLMVDHTGSNSTLECDWKNSNYHFSHVLASGSTSEEHYGLKLAHKLNLPEDILKESRRIVKETDEEKREKRLLPKEARVQRLKFGIQASIKQILKNGRMNALELRMTVAEVKQQYAASLILIDQEFDKEYQERFDMENEQRFDKENEPRFDKENQQRFDKKNQQRFDKEKEQRFDKKNEQRFDKEKEQRFDKENQQRFDKEKEQRFDKEKEQRFDKENEKRFDKENEKRFDKENEKRFDKENEQRFDKENEQRRFDKEKEQRFDKEKEQQLDKKNEQRLDKKNEQRFDKKNEQRFDKEKEQRFDKEKEQRFDKEKEQRFDKEKEQRFDKENQQRFDKGNEQRFDKENQQRFDKGNEQRFDKENEQRFDKENQQRFDKGNEQRFDKEKEQRFDKENQQRFDKKNEQRFDKKNDQRFDKKNDQRFDKENEQRFDMDIDQEEEMDIDQH